MKYKIKEDNEVKLTKEAIQGLKEARKEEKEGKVLTTDQLKKLKEGCKEMAKENLKIAKEFEPLERELDLED